MLMVNRRNILKKWSIVYFILFLFFPRILSVLGKVFPPFKLLSKYRDILKISSKVHSR